MNLTFGRLIVIFFICMAFSSIGFFWGYTAGWDNGVNTGHLDQIVTCLGGHFERR